MEEVTIVIPNWNGRKVLGACLDSLRAQTLEHFSILMIDNGSTDGSAAFVREHYPEVHIKRYARNTGFCQAVNAGIRLSKTPYVILLNNDVKCDSRFAQELLQAIKEKKNAFSCQAKMLQMADPSRVDDAGDFFTACGWAFARGKGKDEQLYTEVTPIFSSCAGAAIYSRELLKQTGLFDKRHFAYLEDVDLGYRAQLLGYENYLVPSARVLHMGSAASGSRYNAFKARLSARNNIYVIRKNMPAWQLALNLPLMVPAFLAKACFYVRKGLGKEYMQGLLEGIRAAGLKKALPDQKQPGRYIRVQLKLWENMLRLFE